MQWNKNSCIFRPTYDEIIYKFGLDQSSEMLLAGRRSAVGIGP